MKKKRLQLFLMLMKLSIFGVFLQSLLLTSIFAHDSEAQKIQSVKEYKINLNFQNENLEKVLKVIENNTVFTFHYDRKVVDLNKKVTITGENRSLYDYLIDLSKQTQLRFKQLNTYISVSQAQPQEKVEVEVIIQTRNVTGKVTSFEDNEPLPGVNVIEKGTSNGTVTNVDGEYQITVSEGATLVFSSVGYVPEEVVVENKSVIDLELLQDIQQLQELVVVGYGTQKKANLTGAVSSVDITDIETVPAANTATLLQGRLPGVTVSNFDPQPGRDDPQIRIRGIGTFNSGQNPLVIVDGVQSSLNQIPTSDIESVTVLKDAASAAIYGVRAANGVIIVTTKRGKVGKPTVSIKSNVAFQQTIENPNYLDSWDFAEIKNIWSVADGGNEVYTPEMIQAMRDGSDPDHFANTDWWDVAFKTAPMQTHYASVSGGNESTRYLVSTEYLDQEGVLNGTSANRFSLRGNLDADVSEKFSIGLNLYGYKRRFNETAVWPTTSAGDNSLVYSIRRFTQPTVPVRYSNGEYGFVDGVYPDYGAITRNPLFAAETGKNFTDQNRVEGRLFGNYELFKNFNIMSSLAYSNLNTSSSEFTPTFQQTFPNGDIANENINNNLNNTHGIWQKTEIENLLTYDKDFDNHSFNFLAGHTAQLIRNDWDRSYIEGFANNEIHELDGGVSNMQVSGNAYEIALQSFFGRVNYNYLDKYLLEFNIRHDGSSRMPDHSRYGTFPSFSAGWVMSEENFMSNVNFISFMKLRGSWGQLGNQEIGNQDNLAIWAYPYVQNLATGQDYLIDGSIRGGVAISNLANPDLHWETTTISDIGFDLHLFEDKLQIVADYFDKTSSEVLIALPISSLVGVSGVPYQNLAEVQNRGWELDVRYQNHIGDFNYFTSFNLSNVKNEIKDIAGLENWISGNSINVVGEPIGAYYGYISEGYFETQDEIDNHATQWGTLAPGDIKYMDISGPNGEPDGVINAEYDRTIIGNPFPKHQYSFNLGGNFKGFDMSMFFQGIGGIERFNWINTENAGQFTGSILDYWREDNKDAQYPRFGNTPNNTQRSTFWLKNASYLRLKNLEIGYSLPKSLLERLAIQNVRIFFSGYNLLTWTGIEEFDPEKLTNDERNRRYPGTKVYSFGINLNL